MKIIIIFLLVFAGCNPVLKEGNPHYKEPLSGLINIYRGPLNHLTAVRPSTCPMYPSCSAYGLQAIKMHGPFWGYLMTCDRLMRCGRDECRHAPILRLKGKFFYFDPVPECLLPWNYKKIPD